MTWDDWLFCMSVAALLGVLVFGGILGAAENRRRNEIATRACVSAPDYQDCRKKILDMLEYGVDDVSEIR